MWGRREISRSGAGAGTTAGARAAGPAATFPAQGPLPIPAFEGQVDKASAWPPFNWLESSLLTQERTAAHDEVEGASAALVTATQAGVAAEDLSAAGYELVRLRS